MRHRIATGFVITAFVLLLAAAIVFAAARS